MAPPATRSGVWLFGPATDLLLGGGLLYAFVFFGLVGSDDALRAAQPAWLLPVMLVLVSLPHYGATLLRVYERRDDRRRYALFAVWASLAVLAAFALSLRDAAAGSLLLSLYLTWSPWHYTGQNYGLCVMFLRRGGVELAPGTKRWLHASFLLSYALVFLAYHQQEGSGMPQFQARLGGDSAVAFLPLGIPQWIAWPAFLAALAGCALALGVCALRLSRAAPPRTLLPAACLVGTQALWFSIPITAASLERARGGAPSSLYGSALDWVALMHAAQYLWITAWYARASPDWRGHARYFGKVLVAGVALWTLPIVLFSPDLIGPRSSTAAVAMLAAAAINVHHFVLDGAIWKLRDGRIAAVLLRPVATAAARRPERSWPRRAVWTLATVFVLLHAAGSLELGVRRAEQPPDWQGLRAAVGRLRWLGLDDPETRFQLGVEAGARGDLGLARRDFERSLELEDQPRGWIGLAHTEYHEGRIERARAALLRAERAAPSDPETWLRSAEVWRGLGDLERAGAALRRAQALADGGTARLPHGGPSAARGPPGAAFLGP